MTIPDAFGKGAPDELWIPRVDADGWIVLTRDHRIRFRPNETVLLSEHRAIMFLLPQATGEKTGAVAALCLPNIRRIVRGCRPGCVGRVHPTGDIDVLWEDGKRLSPPRRKKLPSKHRAK